MTFPLHLAISEKLRDRIRAGIYRPGDQLPSEHQLMAEFEVSRITARRAIANLTQQGLVNVQRGKGAFVSTQQKVVYSLSSPLLLEADLARQDIEITVQTLSFERVTAPVHVQKILNCAIAYLQKKVLLFNNVPSCVDITYIVPELAKAHGKELRQKLTFTTLEKYGICIQKIDAVIECTQADYETGEQLEVSLGHPLIVYRHTAFTEAGAIVHGESISRGDRFCYSIQIDRMIAPDL
ncbi:UbiC transcription regulator-associated domain protein [Leptolyngbya boryana NIES-2135]|jgi:GntR family transcriptional regulator|uniref:UbiC transcription regulator-associated domain protein n=1 Tax=Leptolyngbya boryana NIES-2135 TaxID=1973484 RepID=A0A1Z4JQ72_LEPBY|nr:MULTISPECIES: GntR family transcriptional regulator [Leptolyngbya]BAY58872.1 UbiC transcription regulator-associated domain protein [Leptolyngbya boryana NIES-2135]MBD2370540.1 GntR family transcriptional regulator [Leptolyngbya sp. FACHB-161]MBD2376964.1 GntR family transcriptional regulator [Leptolyngbya sp. FACHB-238]MBD2401331.1 GntR family transcriptional regulator [Leptolyngbya sp. FACHB-239]MBD2407882.1 GntR family transcriptional regulator [Leptolyngbya sp. FACHB-402]